MITSHLKLLLVSLLLTLSVILSVRADNLEKGYSDWNSNPSNRINYEYRNPPPPSQQNVNNENVTNRAVAMFLAHGITGLVLLILGRWYYQRQKRWDEESADMRRELLEYVKADQTSDYEMMKRIDDSKQELKDEMIKIREELMLVLQKKL